MNFEFRKLTKENIPAITEISSHMPSYFQNILTNADNLMNNPIGYYFGLFDKSTLLGVGNLRYITQKFAWIESIRVAPNNQKKGIGTALFQHGVEKAKERKCSVVAYATEGSNYGSCKIGEELGFQLVTSMIPLWLILDDIVLAADMELKHQPISVDEVFDLMNSIPNGPDEEVCLGWEFVPKDKSIFDDKKELKFFAVEKTLLLEPKVDNRESKEGSFAKSIIYGAEKHVKELLEDFIRRNSSCEFLNCVISDELEHIPKEIGFTNHFNADGSPVKTLLWKMKLA